MKSVKNYSFLLLCVYLLLFLAGCREIEDKQTNRLNKILNDGNAALLAKQYEKAIEFYSAGLAVIPDEPVFLGNKATALRLRGADTYNSAIRISDREARDKELSAAKNDFRESAKLSNQALIQLKNMSFVDSLFSKSIDEMKLSAYSSYADSMRLVATTVDKTKATDALEASRVHRS